MDKSKYFFCYDFGLQEMFKHEGVEYITTAISNAGRRFWLYERTPRIEKIIKSYRG